jgi:gluconate 5-dehydrogenase
MSRVHWKATSHTASSTQGCGIIVGRGVEVDNALRDRAVVVTGGGRGLGRAIGLGLLGRGASVMFASRTREQLAETLKLAGTWRDRAAIESVDVRDEASVASLMEAAQERFGRLDVLVNVAGITRRQASMEMARATWEDIITTNLTGCFLCCAAAARVMSARGGGSIINIASIASELALPGRAPYVASKAGVLGLTRALAVEWAGIGIRVNAIGPGYFRTSINEPLYRDDLWANRLHARIPLGRSGRPEELVGAVVFLAGEESGYVTGQILYVDGGFLAGWVDERPEES